MNILDACLLAIVPAFVVLIWVVALSGAAWIGGWSRLAKTYRNRRPFEGFRKRFASGVMCGGPFLGLPCNYGSILTVGANEHGLYLSVTILYRPGHPPLFVPWRDIKAVVERGWLFSYVSFRFEKLVPIRLRVSERLARELISKAAMSDSPSVDLSR